MATDKYAPRYIARSEVDWTTAAQGKVLAWDDTRKALTFADPGGGGGSEEYAIIPILAGNTPILAGETGKPGLGVVNTAVLADANQAFLVLLLSASEGGTAVVTWRDETGDTVLWTDTVDLVAGQNAITQSLTLEEAFPTGVNAISVSVAPDVDVVATCAQVWMWVF